LFDSFSTNQGSGSTTVHLAPADLYDAYGSLRTVSAPLPYHLVFHPIQIWASTGLISLFDNSTGDIVSQGISTVGEDWARNGFAGMVLGFNLWADANIALDGSNNGTGAAFSRLAIKNVTKRGLQIEIMRDISEVATEIVGSEIRGEAIQYTSFGNAMSFV
jgi:hypothetical protein